MAMGPVQVLVVGFGPDADFKGEALGGAPAAAPSRTSCASSTCSSCTRERTAAIDKVEIADEHELAKLGALAGALIGFGAAGEEGAEVGAEAGAELGDEGTLFDDEEVWYIADSIPEGMTAAIAVLEHRWAIPLRNAITDAGGVALTDRWLHPQDLLAVGAEIGMALDD